MKNYNKKLKEILISKESETRKCLQTSKYDIQKQIQN